MRVEPEVLLNDIVHARAGREETRCKERDERTGRDKRLQEAGENIRAQEVQGLSTADDGYTRSSYGNDNGGSPSTRKAGRNRFLESDYEYNTFIPEEVEHRKQAEENRMKLDEDRLRIEQELGTAEAANSDCIFNRELNWISNEKRLIERRDVGRWKSVRNFLMFSLRWILNWLKYSIQIFAECWWSIPKI